MKLTFIDNYDKDEFESIKSNLESKTSYFNTVCDSIVRQYAGDLDDLMTWIYTSII